MTEERRPASSERGRGVNRGVAVRLAASGIALAAGIAALVIAILLVRATLA